MSFRLNKFYTSYNQLHANLCFELACLLQPTLKIEKNDLAIYFFNYHIFIFHGLWWNHPWKSSRRPEVFEQRRSKTIVLVSTQLFSICSIKKNVVLRHNIFKMQQADLSNNLICDQLSIKQNTLGNRNPTLPPRIKILINLYNSNKVFYQQISSISFLYFMVCCCYDVLQILAEKDLLSLTSGASYIFNFNLP